MIYSDLLHAMMKINKLQVLVDKLEVQLKHEKIENKSNSIQIKKLQVDVIISGGERGSTDATRKILVEKDNTIQVLKRKLTILNSEHAQSSELLALQQEKDKIHQEMMEYKGKMVKLQEEKNKWETE